MAITFAASLVQSAFAGRQVAGTSSAPAPSAGRNGLVVRAAATPNTKLWAPGVEEPTWLDRDMPGYYGFDPMGLGSDPKALQWYRQAELVHARWAMLGVAGILAQELVHPDQFWYYSGLPQNVPSAFGNNGTNLATLLAVEFLLMHWVEVRRFQDIRKFGSVNEDPLFKGNKVPNPEMGYPGGVFDPLGFAKGDMKAAQTKEIKNGRLAMVAFMGFVFAAQATGKNPLAALQAHMGNPFGNNFTTNIGTCAIPSSINVDGLTVPLTCLWPGQHL